MDNLKQLENLHAYYDAMLSGGYDGDDKETWETLHAALLNTKEQIKALKLNGGNGKGGNGKSKGGNGGNGKNGGHEKDAAGLALSETDEPVLHDDATDEPVYSRESA